MGTVGPLLAAAVEALRQQEELEKVAVLGFFKPQTRFDRVAQYLRKVTSSPVNPYTVATKAPASAVKRAVRGGLGKITGRAMRVGIAGLFAHEFITGMRANMAASRKAVKIWGA